MERVHFFVPSEQYLQQVAILFEVHRKKILRLVPTAQVEHIGATSVPGLLTKGDLDLQAIGVLPHQYVVERRIERAKQLLKQTWLPIMEIALQCGFSSHSHLGKLLRQHTGLSPKAYRSSRT